MILSPVQCRMARAALGMGVRELASTAKVSMDTVVRFERGEQLKDRTVEAIQHALEAGGVEFTNGDQPGVRLTKEATAQFRMSARFSKPTTVPRPTRSKTAKANQRKD